MCNNLYTEAEKYLKGNGVPCDYEKAVELYTQAAQDGSSEAARRLARIYSDGEIVRRDFSASLRFYELAAQLGDANDSFLAALVFSKGEITEKNKEKAVNYYLTAANAGHIKAQNNLGNIYKEEGNFEEAVKWYEKAAQGGSEAAKKNLELLTNFNAPAIYSLALSSADKEKAEKYLKRAAELNYTEAMELLGDMYIKKGERQNAEDIYKKALSLGKSGCALKLGDLYFDESLKTAEKYYKQAYAHGVAGADEKYAMCLKDERRMFKKTAKADKIMKKSK